MALDHLSTKDLETLRDRGLEALSTESLELLKLPEGQGMLAKEEPQPLPPGVNPATPIEEGASPSQPFGSLNDLQSMLSQGAGELKQAVGGGTLGILAAAPANIAASLVPTTPTEGALTALSGPTGEVLGAAGTAIVKSKLGQKALQGLYKLGPNVYPKVSKYVLENFDRVMGAKSVEKATEDYIEQAEKYGIKHVDESIKRRFGERVDPTKYYGQLEEEGVEIANKHLLNQEIGEVRPIQLDNGKLIQPQHALDSIQALNLKERSIPINVKEKSLREKQLQAVGAAKNALYDYLEAAGNPAMREKARAMRDAYAKETVTNILPRNLSGDQNVVRAILAATGNLGPLAPLTSPAVVTGALRTGRAVGGALESGAGALAGKPLAKITESKSKKK